MVSEKLHPDDDCALCPRLVGYRRENQSRFPDWHNGPVSAFGSFDSPLLIVGLAPGLKGANRTNRPFTGDGAGDLLYPTLKKHGLARGTYAASVDDGLELVNCRITNAVRCVPPQNRVTGPETMTCRSFLISEIAMMSNLKAILALGGVSHGAILASFGLKKSASKFAHAARHDLPGGLILTDSYHCSRYNTNTGRLTEKMFDDVFQAVVSRL